MITKADARKYIVNKLKGNEVLHNLWDPGSVPMYQNTHYITALDCQGVL